MYVLKMLDSGLKISPEMSKDLEIRKNKEEYTAAKLAFQKVGAAREAQKRHDTVLCLRTAERAMEFVMSQPRRLIQHKWYFFLFV